MRLLTCAIHQPNLFPRLSTLFKLYATDIWIVLDTVQFNHRDYQHRARLAALGDMRIREKVETYRAGLPVNLPITDEGTYYGNFEAEFRNFWTNCNYYCIFTVLGMLPRTPLPALAYKPESTAAAELLLSEIKRKQRHAVETLPSHYDLLRQLHAVS
jgi:WbqC-like protein family